MGAPMVVRHRESERGQAMVLVAVVVVFCGLLAVGAARAGAVLIDRQRAQIAADAAALVAVEGGRGEASDIAGRNGAVLVSWRVIGSDVIVEVRSGSVTAVARASSGP